jgi:uncharacterized membrane protein
LAISGGIFHVHHRFTFFSILVLFLIVLLAFLFLGLVGRAFGALGFGSFEVSVLLVATLLGSTINIPLWKMKSLQPMTQYGDVSVFGVTFRIPQTGYGVSTTQVAINLGGAVIPSAVSLYLLWRTPATLAVTILGVAIVASITHLVARPVRGVGIVTPAFVAPIAAALFAIIAQSPQPFIVAYSSGVLGALIGADLTNLDKIKNLGAPVASIGGAGTFDGVFLSGIIAVLLA